LVFLEGETLSSRKGGPARWPASKTKEKAKAKTPTPPRISDPLARHCEELPTTRQSMLKPSVSLTQKTWIATAPARSLAMTEGWGLPNVGRARRSLGWSLRYGVGTMGMLASRRLADSSFCLASVGDGLRRGSRVFQTVAAITW
jgi:hypothetical protein